jgi:hypothetical protein
MHPYASVLSDQAKRGRVEPSEVKLSKAKSQVLSGVRMFGPRAPFFLSRNRSMAAPELLVYPRLWSQSLVAHPHDWKSQFRTLAKLAKGYWQTPSVPVGILGPGEAKLIHSLAHVNVEVLILMLGAEFPTEGNPLHRLDPTFLGTDAVRAASRTAATKERPP